jgi:hypothetical protein
VNPLPPGHVRPPAPPLSAAERAVVDAFDRAPAVPESAPWVRDFLGLAEELERDSERAYQRSCGAYRDEFSDGQHHAYDLAATRVRDVLAAVLAADPEPRQAVVERMARAMCSVADFTTWDLLHPADVDHYRVMAAAALDAEEGRP